MKTKLLIGFFITIIVVYFGLNYEKNKRIDEYLTQQTKEFEIMYNTQYKHFKEKSRVIYDMLVVNDGVLNIYKDISSASNEQKDILREQLHSLIKDKYKKLKYTKLQQMHFHLPSNESFLRLHKLSEYGDDLTHIRQTVAYVSKNHQFIDGFEAGRHYSGYRFIYPIKDENNTYLGSVEVSFNVVAFTLEFMEHFKVLSNFHIKKSIIDQKAWKDAKNENYIDSPVPKYYLERNAVQQVVNYSNVDFKKLKMSQDNIDNVLQNIDNGKAIAVFDEKVRKIKIFLPVKNPISDEVVGFLSITSDGKYIINEISNFYIILIVIVLFVTIVFGLIYREFKNQENTNKLLDANLKQLETLQQQAKLASMGEMIGAIAHQWRQPLNAISMSIQNLDDDYEDGLIDEKFLDEFITKNNAIVKFMSKTIDDFRNFFRVDKEKENFSVKNAIAQTVSIQSAQLKNSYIELVLLGEDFQIHGFQSEFQQVILNLINNAKDVILDKKIKNGKISISLEKGTVTIEDNGGGVPNDISKRIFEPYFTTKEQGKGTGIGLYMSKMIIENNIGGRIKVQNHENCARFILEIPRIK